MVKQRDVDEFIKFIHNKYNIHLLFLKSKFDEIQNGTNNKKIDSTEEKIKTNFVFRKLKKNNENFWFHPQSRYLFIPSTMKNAPDFNIGVIKKLSGTGIVQKIQEDDISRINKFGFKYQLT